MEVKLVVRTLDVFELFSKEGKPLSLTDMGARSTCRCPARWRWFAPWWPRAISTRPRKRGGYFPTRKMLLVCQSIDAADQVLELVRPFLEELRNISQETAVLGKRQDGQVIYLDVALSHQPIRYHVQVGESRAAHTNSIGKAIFPCSTRRNRKRCWPRRTGAPSPRAPSPRARPSCVTWRKPRRAAGPTTWARAWKTWRPSPCRSSWPRVVCGFHRRPVRARMERNWDAHVETFAANRRRLRQAIAVHEGAVADRALRIRRRPAATAASGRPI